MDPLSQGLAGGLVAPLFSESKKLRVSFFVGFFSALLADLDIFIRSSDDPLLSLEYHRHFTHSLLFVPLGGLVGALLTWIFLRNKVGFWQRYKYASLGYLTAAPLDACTSYGTHLFWPFSDARTAWHIISIVDPVFTGILLILSIAAFWTRRKAFVVVACVFAFSYLALGSVQRDRAERVAMNLAKSRGQIAARLSVKPSIGNILLWRSVYETSGVYQVDAILLNPFVETKVYEGGVIPLVRLDSDFKDIEEGSTLKGDIERFAFFSDYYLAFHPQHPEVLGDMRYAMLPNSTEPLWGVSIDRLKPNSHVKWLHFREARKQGWIELKKMLLGR